MIVKVLVQLVITVATALIGAAVSAGASLLVFDPGFDWEMAASGAASAVIAYLLMGRPEESERAEVEA